MMTRALARAASTSVGGLRDAGINPGIDRLGNCVVLHAHRQEEDRAVRPLLPAFTDSLERGLGFPHLVDQDDVRLGLADRAAYVHATIDLAQ